MLEQYSHFKKSNHKAVAYIDGESNTQDCSNGVKQSKKPCTAKPYPLTDSVIGREQCSWKVGPGSQESHLYSKMAQLKAFRNDSHEPINKTATHVSEERSEQNVTISWSHQIKNQDYATYQVLPLNWFCDRPSLVQLDSWPRISGITPVCSKDWTMTGFTNSSHWPVHKATATHVSGGSIPRIAKTTQLKLLSCSNEVYSRVGDCIKGLTSQLFVLKVEVSAAGQSTQASRDHTSQRLVGAMIYRMKHSNSPSVSC